MAILTSDEAKVSITKLELSKEPVIIGRHPECDLNVDDISVSRHHAQITNEQGNFYVQDLNSRNGTFLNSEQVHKPTKLYDGSRIQICDFVFTFHLTESSAHKPVLPPPTRVDAEDRRKSTSSVILEDDVNSTVMSQLEVPSHHMDSRGVVSADQKLAALIKVIHSLSETVERNQILERVLDCMFDLFVDADRGFIILADKDGKLRPMGVKTRRPQDSEQMRISRTIVNQVMATQRPIISKDAASDGRFDMSESLADFRIRSIMCAPLINSKNESIGVVQLDTLKRSLVFTEEHLEILVTVAMQASLAIQKSDLFDESVKTEAMRADLRLAHELQQRFLPQRAPDLESYKFFSFYKAMQQVGGDYFDYVQLDEHRTGVIVADVVGHGIAAALLMAKVSADSRYALATCKSPLEAVQKMNNSLSGMNLDRFVTLVLGMIDRRDHTMRIVNAGHMPPIVRSNNGDIKLVAAKESGLPLGILEDAEYHELKIDLGPGDVVVMFTDGVNESMNRDGEQLTTNRLIQEIQDSQTKTPETIGSLICQTVDRHVGLEEQIDDICLVCVGRTP